MADLRQELIEQHRHGPETYMGQLCLRAAEEIRRLENENYFQGCQINAAKISLTVRPPDSDKE